MLRLRFSAARGGESSLIHINNFRKWRFFIYFGSVVDIYKAPSGCNLYHFQRAIILGLLLSGRNCIILQEQDFRDQ